MLTITNHKRNAIHTIMGYNLKKISMDEDMDKLEPLDTVGRIVNGAFPK